MPTDLNGFHPNSTICLVFDESRDIVVNEFGDCFAADRGQCRGDAAVLVNRCT
jgi:hypothetical protein